MAKLSGAVVAVLAVAAVGCGGKKAPADYDCAAAIDNAMKVSADEMKQNGIPDAAVPRMKDVSLARCTEDKWSPDVRRCLAEAKTAPDVTGCQGKLEPAQQEAWTKAITSIDTGGEAAGSADAGSAAAGSADAGSAAVAVGDLPAECGDYKAMIDKLAACDQLPAAARDALKQSFDAMAQQWSKGAPSADAKQTMATACKQGADAVRQVATTPCGW